MPNPSSPQVAVIGAGLAGIACARTLTRAGASVRVFEKALKVGGRMGSRQTPFGSFDHGAQAFTVRDPRFETALRTVPESIARWSTPAVHVVDPLGRITEAADRSEVRWVGTPAMEALPRAWAAPLADAGALVLGTRVQVVERDAVDSSRWQLQTLGDDGSVRVFAGFDAVLFATPASQAADVLERSRLAPTFVERLRGIEVAPCWTLMLAFPQAATALGPAWNAAFSAHHRVAWVARESSKPGRGPVERWTVHASPAWSQEHAGDDPQRVEAKLRKAFAEVTGIRAEPSHTAVKLWRHAKTLTPLGRPHLWDARLGLGACGDWCLGHRAEHAFVSGLELALAALAR
ncbi:FAD-dependent oxidoreductase [Ramlibacter sp. CrO1]|uniref:FAD-dependent oxidoreductase n=2 Tax=Ramlibacter algicola TaxID=2795217 RepID=A0A934Q262_9BURK|nr:FAD-dependent oxidoreductase [Ramlibacter algicola]MBK0392924.1 FAD-dependent oxidoreductase [Ramlibacter algicola]